MNLLSFDWATKKTMTYYDLGKDKVKELPNRFEEFEKFIISLKKPHVLLFEMGGADTLKLLAFRGGHTVLQTPGKKARDYRVKKGILKDDLIDPKTLYEFYIEERGGAVTKLKTIDLVPLSFYKFTEQGSKLVSIKILFRQHEDLKKDMVREKLKLLAFRKRFELVTSNGNADKFIKNMQISIKAKEAQIIDLKKEMERALDGQPVWDKYLKGIKGAGPMIASGLIGELGGRQFESDESLKHYVGLIPKADLNGAYNRYVKNAIYQFVESVIKHKTPIYRKFYDDIKGYYRDKHSDWRPVKIDAYTKKVVATKFVLEFWDKYQELS